MDTQSIGTHGMETAHKSIKDIKILQLDGIPSARILYTCANHALWNHTNKTGFIPLKLSLQYKSLVSVSETTIVVSVHDDVIKWKHFPRYWPFVRGIHRSPVNFPHKGHWRGALMFSLICTWINGWVNNRKAGDLRHHRTHYDVTIMLYQIPGQIFKIFPTTEYSNNIFRLKYSMSVILKHSTALKLRSDP